MPCCFIGERPDIETINTVLRTKGIRPAEKLTGLSRHLLTRHLKECLGEVPVNLPLGLAKTVAKLAMATPNSSPPPSEKSNSPHHEDPAMDAAMATNVSYAAAMLYSPRWGHPRTARTEEQRIAFLQDLIETNRFYFRRTLDGLAAEWGETGTEVRRLFLLARSKLSEDRQGAAVQLEVTLNALEAQERHAMGEYRRLRKVQPSVARGYLGLARQIRGDIAEFTGLRKIRLEAELNVWTRPEFVTAVDRITDASLGILLPGTEQDERGMEALCGKVEQSLGTQLSERERALIAEALAQAAAVVDERIVQIVAEASGKNAGAGSEPMAAE